MGDWGLGGSRPEVEDVVGGFDCSVITGFFFFEFYFFSVSGKGVCTREQAFGLDGRIGVKGALPGQSGRHDTVQNKASRQASRRAWL